MSWNNLRPGGRRFLLRPVLAVAALVAALAVAPHALAATYTVTTTADSGGGSLREAIALANADDVADTIAFSVPFPYIIQPSTPLPDVTTPIVINAATQPGYSASPLVLIDGSACSCSGLTATAGSNLVVNGLAVGNFNGFGIVFNNAPSGAITNSYVGLSPVPAAAPNASGGIAVLDSNNVALDGNVVAANAPGSGAAQILISGVGTNNTVVRGSKIGLGPDGNTTYAGSADGIFIGNLAHNTTIGGNAFLAGITNEIDGLTGYGIRVGSLGNSGGSGNFIQGNRIGLTDLGSSSAAPPTGIGIFSTTGTVIGASLTPDGLGTPGASDRGNVIAGASSAAILLSGLGQSVVAYNYIGVDKAGAGTNPNGDGIRGTTALSNQIGPGNVIAHNDHSGVSLDSSSVDDRIVANSIHDNGAGITLASGANHDLPAPTVSVASPRAASGTVTGPPNRSVFVEVFKNASCAAAAGGAGDVYLGFATVALDDTGHGTWVRPYLALSPPVGITATSTDAVTQDTSVFSNCTTIAQTGSLGGTLATSLANFTDVDLTSSGFQDWAIWGYANGGTSTSLSPDVRKSGGSAISALIDSDPSFAPLRGLGSFPAGTPFTFDWSNGSGPTTASAVTGGLQHDGDHAATPGPTVGDGFSFTVPADTTPRTLKVYTSAHFATGQLTATLSDGSAGVYADGYTGVPGNAYPIENQPGVYTITYAAANPNQTLNVQWVETAGSCNPGCDNVAIYAVTLTAGAPAPPAPVLFDAVPSVGTSDNHLGVDGLVTDNVPQNTSFDVSFFAAATCGAVSPTALGTHTVSTGSNPNGIAGFAFSDLPNVQAGWFAWATASRGGPDSLRSNCVRVGPNNINWTSAATIGDPNGNGNATGYLDSLGQGRWFKVPILPNSRVDINLTNLPADYDLVAFSDIKQAYDSLNSSAVAAGTQQLSLQDVAAQSASAPDDVFNTSQYNPSSWDATNWDPSFYNPVTIPSQWSPSQWSPSQWSPSQWSPSQWSPSQWSPSQWSPSQWSPSQWSPSQWSPSQWSPSQWSPSQWSPGDTKNLQTFSDAQTRSLLAVSAGTGTGDEHISVNTWNNTGFVYIRVQGKNGSFDPANAFSLSVARDGNSCAGVGDTGSSPTAPSNGYKTVILYDSTRLDTSTLTTRLQSLASRPEVAGALVDVNGDTTVHSLNAQADAHLSCPYAKNLVASAIKREVDAYRATNPIKYVVVVGGDSVIPFFRYADPSLLGNETRYSPPVADNTASQASLRLGYVLNDDGYGSSRSVALHGNLFPVPDLAVGRLVETPAEIGGMLDAYLTGTSAGTVPTPTSSLVTGYDFLQDAADNVESNLAAGIGGSGNDTLITNENVSPALTTVNGIPDRNHSWTAADLRAKLLGGTHHDLIFLAGHFSANDALAADYATNILSTDLVSSTTDFTNSVVFSAGCHSGYNIVNGDGIPNVTGLTDWAEAFATKKATLIAGTGYQYGDTDFLAYSERVYAEFARQLRLTPNTNLTPVPVAVGDALLNSKTTYLKTTPTLSGLDEKALLEATLFGLPMLNVNMPNGRIYQAADASTVNVTTLVSSGPGNSLGLRTADTSVNGPGTSHSVPLVNSPGSTGTAPTASYYTGPNGALAIVPTQPVLPLFDSNVTAPASDLALGYLLRGVGFRSGSYTDTPSVTPLTAAPATELRGVHAPFFSDVFFPVQPYSVNYYGALAQGTSVTRLEVTPVQHISDSPTTMTRRTYSSMGYRLFYSSNTGAPTLAAPPTVTGVDASVSGGSVSVSAHVIGAFNAGVQNVWVTWTLPPTGGGTGQWQSLDLTQDASDPTLWIGTLPATFSDPSKVAFMVQAVNGVGRVTLDSNVGAYYHPNAIPGQAPPNPLAPTTISLTSPPTSAQYGDRITVTAHLVSGAAALDGKTVRIALGSTSLPATTNTQGNATVTMPVDVDPGTYTLTASFAGDSVYAASDATATLAVAARATNLTLSVGFASALSSVSATLTDQSAPTPAPLAQRNVFFIITGIDPTNTSTQQVVAAKTDATGKASVAAATLAALPAGNYTVDAYFNGVNRTGVLVVAADNIDYAPSTATYTVGLLPANAAVFTRNNRIWFTNPDGSGPAQQLTQISGRDVTGTWLDDQAVKSPNGRKIVFTRRSKASGSGQLWVIDSDGRNAKQLTSGTGDNDAAAWSRDGTKIAFQSTRTGSKGYDIWTAAWNASTGLSNYVNVTNTLGDDQYPSWSPSTGTNSGQIAFASNRAPGNQFEIFRMPAAGGAATQLTTNAARDLEPSWSPDGSKISFSSNRAGGSAGLDVYVMSAAGGTPTRLTTSTGDDKAPFWIDNARIVFSSTQLAGLAIVAPTGGTATKIANTAAGDANPG